MQAEAVQINCTKLDKLDRVNFAHSPFSGFRKAIRLDLTFSVPKEERD